MAWITAEDRGLAAWWSFVRRPAGAGGPDAATGPATDVRSAGHAAHAGEYRELGGYGLVARLDCAGRNEASGPLYDEHGFLAGWHAVRVVDGQTLSFALPLERIKEGLTEIAPVSVAEWNQRRKPEADEIYSKALGHLWAGDFEGAAFYWRKASVTEPDNARVWYHLAFMEGKTGHSQAKNRCFRRAIALQPDFADAHYNLGIGLALAGDNAGALDRLRRCRRSMKAWRSGWRDSWASSTRTCCPRKRTMANRRGGRRCSGAARRWSAAAARGHTCGIRGGRLDVALGIGSVVVAEG